MNDPDGFEQFVAARSARLVHVAYLLTGDRHLAHDLGITLVPPTLSRALRAS